MNYEVIQVFLTKEDKQHYEDLLHDINNGKREDFINIFSMGTKDFTFYLDLASGTENYYLQYELVDKNNNVVDTDTIDELEDFTIRIDNYNSFMVHFSTLENIWR